MEFWLPLWIAISFWVALGTIQRIAQTNARERSRREIAAYIAEGSMTPEQGERLMRAGESPEKH